MKEKSLVFIIGMLVGAIIASGAFLIINNSISKNNGIRKDMQMPNMENFNQDDMKSIKGNREGKDINKNDGTTPTEMPNGEQPFEMNNLNN